MLPCSFRLIFQDLPLFIKHVMLADLYDLLDVGIKEAPRTVGLGRLCWWQRISAFLGLLPLLFEAHASPASRPNFASSFSFWR
jgi:hypothetical protein